MRLVGLIVLTIVLLSGCATMIRGTEQEVSVNTVPLGARVQLSNGEGCESPCTMTAKRDESLLITVAKE